MTDGATLALARALIERRSITPADAGCLDLIAARLAALGFELTPLPFADVSNLWARRGTSAPLLVFAGHTDVVPTGPLEAWTSDPFVPTERDGYLYGRGAADMKGSLAAMVTAIERFVGRHPDHVGSIGVLFTSDEEGPAVNGTVKVMEYLAAADIHIDYCVVGEPSSRDQLGDVVRIGRRGSLNGRLEVLGIQGHVAYPDDADNPIHRAVPALTELCGERWDDGNEHYPPTSFQISNLASGTGVDNVIPGVLEARFNFRFCTESTADGLAARVGAILERHGLRTKLEWNLSGAPFLTAVGDLVPAVSEVVTRTLEVEPELSTGGGTSDGRFIAPSGAEVIELGPVNATIHKVNECVLIADLDRLSVAYEGILNRLLTT